MRVFFFWLRAVIIPLAMMAIAAVFVWRAVAIPNPPRISSAVIATGFSAFGLLAAFATVTRGWLQNGLVSLATLCLFVGGFEAYAAQRKPRLESRSAGLFGSDPVLGARPAHPGRFPARLAVDGKVIYDVTYTIDDKRRRLTRANPGGPHVVFFGDSWTFGEGLNDGETLPQVFADITGADVTNYGFSGLSPAQTLRAMETGVWDKDIDGARLFILQTAPFHIPRTACRYVWTAGAPRYISIDGRAVYDGPCKVRWWQYTATYEMLIEPSEERITGDEVERYLDIVQRIAELARDKYHVALLIIDDAWLQPYLKESRVGFTTKDVEARFKATGAMVIDNETAEKNPDVLEIPYDYHPTALADRLMAKKIVATLEADRPNLLYGMPKVDVPRADSVQSVEVQPGKAE